MSNELRTATGSGNTLYAHAVSSSARRWNGTAFEVYSSSNYPNYDIPLTEQGISGVYVGDFPSAITDSGVYEIFYYLQDGASPAEGDRVVGIGSINWDGSSSVAVGASVSGELAATDWADYIVRTFKRTDKTTELYEATNEAIAEIRRTIRTAREEKEVVITDQISTLGQYKMDVETDFGLSISDVFIRDESESVLLVQISKAMFDAKYSRFGTSSGHRRKPKHWCLFGGEIYVGPVPDSVDYEYLKSYAKDDHVLVTAATVSVPFTTTEYREILKHGVLMRLYSLVENDVQAQKYAAFWKKGLQEMEMREDRNRGGSTFCVAYNDF